MAALALQFGWDPLTFLGLTPGDATIGTAVLSKAVELRHDRETDNLEFVAAKNAQHILGGMVQLVNGQTRSLGRLVARLIPGR